MAFMNRTLIDVGPSKSDAQRRYPRGKALTSCGGPRVPWEQMAERISLEGAPQVTGLPREVVIDLRDPDHPRRIEGPAAPPPEGLRDDRPAGLPLLLALNALNLLDAVLTYVVTSSGIAREGNPVVEAMTLPGKVVFVAGLSVLLWWLRPKALVVPLVGYVLVVCYTIAGAFFLS